MKIIVLSSGTARQGHPLVPHMSRLHPSAVPSSWSIYRTGWRSRRLPLTVQASKRQAKTAKGSKAAGGGGGGKKKCGADGARNGQQLPAARNAVQSAKRGRCGTGMLHSATFAPLAQHTLWWCCRARDFEQLMIDWDDVFDALCKVSRTFLASL